MIHWIISKASQANIAMWSYTVACVWGKYKKKSYKQKKEEA